MQKPSSPGRTDTASEVISAPAEQLYAAFADPDALMTWLPPAGMTGRALEFDFRHDGRYRIELRYGEGVASVAGKTSSRTDVTKGRFLALEPSKRIVQSVHFESKDDSFAGEMVMTWMFEPLPSGTRVTVTAENVPPGISEGDHKVGLRSSLQNLAHYIQRHVTAEGAAGTDGAAR